MIAVFAYSYFPRSERRFTALTPTNPQTHRWIQAKWSRFDTFWEGIAVTEVLSHLEVLPQATHVMVLAEHGFTSNLSLEDFDRPENLFALRYDGMELTPDHGWPLRLVAPHLYFWKSVKWVRGLRFIEGDQPGFWERNGYHMRGDPWAEERYWGD